LLTKKQLVSDILASGVIPGSALALHSSMKAVGLVDGGPDTLIEAFLEVLGRDGTLMVPTFTYGVKHQGRPFDPETSESVTGLLTEVLRKRPDAVRSIAPVHSVAAIGRLALELTRDHLYSTTLGRYSPYHRLAEAGGSIMLLGCDHNSNSIIHVAESLAEIPYIYTPTPGAPDGFHEIRQKDGRVRKIQLTEFTGCSKAFFRAEPVLRKAGAIKDGQIGNAKTQLMKGNELLKIMTPVLKSDPGLLLCPKPTCNYCRPRERTLTT
jgi:aminoglycoside 3-N-acetyltransferase